MRTLQTQAHINFNTGSSCTLHLCVDVIDDHSYGAEVNDVGIYPSTPGLSLLLILLHLLLYSPQP